MSNLTTSELNSIKDIVSSHSIMSAKLNNFANQTQDPEIKQFLKNASNNIQKGAQDLITFLD